MTDPAALASPGERPKDLDKTLSLATQGIEAFLRCPKLTRDAMATFNDLFRTAVAAVRSHADATDAVKALECFVREDLNAIVEIWIDPAMQAFVLDCVALPTGQSPSLAKLQVLGAMYNNARCGGGRESHARTMETLRTFIATLDITIAHTNPRMDVSWRDALTVCLPLVYTTRNVLHALLEEGLQFELSSGRYVPTATSVAKIQHGEWQGELQDVLDTWKKRYTTARTWIDSATNKRRSTPPFSLHILEELLAIDVGTQDERRKQRDMLGMLGMFGFHFVPQDGASGSCKFILVPSSLKRQHPPWFVAFKQEVTNANIAISAHLDELALLAKPEKNAVKQLKSMRLQLDGFLPPGYVKAIDSDKKEKFAAALITLTQNLLNERQASAPLIAYCIQSLSWRPAVGSHAESDFRIAAISLLDRLRTMGSRKFVTSAGVSV